MNIEQSSLPTSGLCQTRTWAINKFIKCQDTEIWGLFVIEANPPWLTQTQSYTELSNWHAAQLKIDNAMWSICSWDLQFGAHIWKQCYFFYIQPLITYGVCHTAQISIHSDLLLAAGGWLLMFWDATCPQGFPEWSDIDHMVHILSQASHLVSPAFLI